MADVTQNISAQLFVKELPERAIFTGCKQDFNIPYLTTCIDSTESDRAVENAFQSQLNLSEYYKSPGVFDSMKRDYMSKTMEAPYETATVNLNPEPVKNNNVSTPQIDPINEFNTLPLKQAFNQTEPDNNNLFIMIGLISVAAFFLLKG